MTSTVREQMLSVSLAVAVVNQVNLFCKKMERRHNSEIGLNVLWLKEWNSRAATARMTTTAVCA